MDIQLELELAAAAAMWDEAMEAQFDQAMLNEEVSLLEYNDHMEILYNEYNSI